MPNLTQSRREKNQAMFGIPTFLSWFAGVASPFAFSLRLCVSA
jgi:hypothetical protein